MLRIGVEVKGNRFHAYSKLNYVMLLKMFFFWGGEGEGVCCDLRFNVKVEDQGRELICGLKEMGIEMEMEMEN